MHQDTHSADRWRDHAACRPGSGVDPELFYPVGTTGPALAQANEAKAICRQCPVAAPCLIFAMQRPLQEGIWAGTDPDTRRRLASEIRERSAVNA